MTVYQEQISLTNSRIRLALRKRDSKTIFKATLQLCQGDQLKADQLSDWFSAIATSCKSKAKMNIDISMMRMWQLGNMDIKEVSSEGKPSFVLTVSGSEKIKNTPKEKWFEALLWDNNKQIA